MNRSKMLRKVLAGLQAETIAFVSRVESDGGQIIDINYLDECIKKAKELNVYNSIGFWGDANFAVKKDGSDNIEKLYDIGPNQNDLSQATLGQRPTHITDASFNNNFVCSFDNASEDYLLGNSVFTAEDAPMSIFSFARFVTAKNYLFNFAYQNGSSTDIISIRSNGGDNTYTKRDSSGTIQEIIGGATTTNATFYGVLGDGINFDLYENTTTTSGVVDVGPHNDADSMVMGTQGVFGFSESNHACLIGIESEMSQAQYEELRNHINNYYNVF